MVRFYVLCFRLLGALTCGAGPLKALNYVELGLWGLGLMELFTTNLYEFSRMVDDEAL